MSDEEKKAIHLLQSYAGMTHKLTDNQGRPKLDKAIDIVLNLIEKQQKEIKELNKKPIFLIKDLYNRKLKEISLQDAEGLIEQGREEIKDKIKAKIEEYKQVRDEILRNEKEFNRPMMTYDLKRNDYCEKMLKSLLEE